MALPLGNFSFPAALFDYKASDDKYYSFLDLLMSCFVDGMGGDIVVDRALTRFLRALSFGPGRGSLDADLARAVCHSFSFRHRRLLLCDALRVWPRVSPLQCMVPDLGQDVVDYDDALLAARAADAALAAAYNLSTLDTILRGLTPLEG